jgi:hypothetical protein
LIEEREEQLKRHWYVWRLVLQYGIGFVVLVFFVTASFHFRYTPDDAYIYLQYGRNIARGEGFSFNAGTPSYGITGPLWALLIAAGTKLSLDPYTVAKTLDIVFAGLSIIGVLAFAFVVMRDRIYALIAAWIFSFDAWFLRWSGSGTESSIAILLVMLTLWYAYKKEYVTAALVAGLLTLVRPEGVFLFVAVLIDCIVNVRGRKAVIRAILPSFLLYSVVVGSWLLYAWMQFGSIVPNIFLVNPTGGNSVWDSIFSNLRIIGATQILLALLLVAGVIVAVKKSEMRTLREDGFPLLWVLLVPLFYVVMNVQVVSRYLLLILPVVVVYGVWGIKRLEIASLVSPQRGLLILLAVAGLSLGQNQFIYRMWVVPHMETFELGAEECLKPIAYWLRSNSVPGSTVLTPEIGMVGYVSERTVYDMAGLVTPDARRVLNGVGYDEAMTQRLYEKFVHPDYVIDRSSVPERLTTEGLVPVMTRTFSGQGLSNPGLMYYTLYKVVR